MKAIYFNEVNDVKSYLKHDNNKRVVLFSSFNKVKEIAQFAVDNVVLCSTAGEFTMNGYKEDSITGFEYDKNLAEIVEIKYPPIRTLEKLESAYNKVKNNKNAFMLLLCDGLLGVEESIMTTFYFMDNDFKIIGGSAGDNLKFEKTLIYIGKKEVNSVAIFFNETRRTQIIKENIYEPMGKKMLVTDADPINRIVKKFNNKNASVEYADVLGVKEKDLDKCFMDNPLGKRCEDGIYITSPMKINSDKSITFYSQIMPNTFVDVLHITNIDECFRKTKDALEFKPSFVLSINCILRSLKFKNENLWDFVDKELLDICKNQVGFISYGEQFYKHHLNQTMVLLLVE
ncbi:MAG: FIST N-terminal domain-containing protein [Clostridium sp.]